jgi:NAD(P)-dependent dehydrogenase (short-subunit alcohol dehydrogenase family)
MSVLRDAGVLITGGASGIGLATARMVQARGGRVLIADRNPERISAALAELSTADGPPAVGQACDVCSADDCDRLVAKAQTELGRIDALVHSAGILRPPGVGPRPLHEIDEDEFDVVVGTNLKGTFLVNRAVLRAMTAQRSGQIVNVASSSGRRARPLDSVYSASKAGVISLSESAAEEVRSSGIRVQVVLPDAVATPIWQQNGSIPPPPFALPPERIAEVILMMLELPLDATCDQLLVSSLSTRRMRGKGAKPAATAET